MNRSAASSSGVVIYGAGGGGGAGGTGNHVTVSVDPGGSVIINQVIGRGLRQDGMQVKPGTKEQKVIRLLKGDFEKYVGMRYDEFEKIKNDIVENNPGKLI